MRAFKLVFYSLLLTAVAAAFVFRSDIENYIRPKIESELQEFEKTATDVIVQEIKKQIDALPKVEAPPPLRVPLAPVSSEVQPLTVAGTIRSTNSHRADAGLPPLSENQRLNAIASLRVEDMFAKQYFEHVSPSGEDIKDSAASIGYEYITLGENLALGGFSDDDDLLQAWMDSPGHRENILNGKYTEIGIAMRRGMFEGRTTWLAVQVFGKPLALCPSPNLVLKSQVEILNSQIDELQNDLETRRAEIDNSNSNDPDYNRKANEYNAAVARYNELVGQFKRLVADYNAQITKFNECISA